MKITKFGDIEAWQLARRLTQEVYQAMQQEKFAADSFVFFVTHNDPAQKYNPNFM